MIDNSVHNKWTVLKLRDCIIQLTTGLNPRNNFSLGSGNIKYITAKNLAQTGFVDFSNCAYIDSQAKEIIHRRSDIQKGDILFASRAPIGHCHLIEDEPNYFDIGESIFSIRAKIDTILPEYLCLYLSSNYYINMASKRVTGSVIQEIRIGDLLDTDVIVPPKDIQKNIANCITVIDKKLELNQSICSDLDSIAKLLYDYWFVQFDFPDENGKPYKSSGGKMVWNEALKREIPEGWQVKALKGLYIIERGISYSSNEIATNKGMPMINLACIDRNRNYRDGELKYYSGKITDTCYTKAGDLLIACTDLTREREIIGCPILVPDDEQIYTYSTDIAKISFPSSEIDDLFMYMALRTDSYHNYIKAWASGTNVLHLNLAGLDWYKMCFPPESIQHKFANIIRNIHGKNSEVLSENRHLASLRDFLLPMLMNGQVSFKDN